jgi:glycosyltransferase involved in cell wall biosynthesis
VNPAAAGAGRPRVTVVIPTRGRSRLLALTLRGVVRQRDVDFEVVVVDDGSTDDTAAMVKGLEAARVRLLRHDRPRGVSAARNTGIAAARGEWVAFLDDDDLWAPEKLALQLEAADAAHRAWVYAGHAEVDDRLRVIAGASPAPPEQVTELLGRYNAVPAGASNVAVRADALARGGPFDEQLTNNEDWDMWIRLARLGPPAWVPKPLVALRLHAGNASWNTARMLQELQVIERRYGIAADRAAHYRWAAWVALRTGRRGEALRHYGQAVRSGDLKSLARVVMAAARPGVANLRADRLARLAAGQPWGEAAQAWLDELVAGEPGAVLGGAGGHG